MGSEGACEESEYTLLCGSVREYHSAHDETE